MIPRPPSSTLFPYTTLFRSQETARKQITMRLAVFTRWRGEDRLGYLFIAFFFRYTKKRHYWHTGRKFEAKKAPSLPYNQSLKVSPLFPPWSFLKQFHIPRIHPIR